MLKNVRKYKTVAIPIGLWREITRFVEAGIYSSEAEFVREAVRSKLGEVSIVEAQSNIPEEKVEEEIVSYIRERGKAYPSDITLDLGIPYFTVMEIIGKLVKEGRLERAEE